MSASYVARQPIYDRHLRTVGYELLFRTADATCAGDDLDADAASASALVTALADIGLDTLVGDAVAFVNAGRGFIVDGLIRVCPPGRVVVEVLESVAADAEVVDALRALVADGYAIALDDFVLDASTAPLVALANFVKIEVNGRSEDDARPRARPAARLPAAAASSPRRSRRARSSSAALELGFSHFQGYYFSRPELCEGCVIDPGRLSRLQLLANLRDPDVDPDRLERLIARDLGLSHRVLLFVNSAYVGLPRRIGSIREAILLLGFRQLRLFADIVVLADCNRRLPASC